MSINVGDIRFKVYTGHDGKPWVGEIQVVSISPKGQSVRFNHLDTVRPTASSHKRDQLPSDTVKGAIREYQYDMILLMPSEDKLGAIQLDLILAAEKLARECSDSDDDRGMCG